MQVLVQAGILPNKFVTLTKSYLNILDAIFYYGDVISLSLPPLNSLKIFQSSIFRFFSLFTKSLYRSVYPFEFLYPCLCPFLANHVVVHLLQPHRFEITAINTNKPNFIAIVDIHLCCTLGCAELLLNL